MRRIFIGGLLAASALCAQTINGVSIVTGGIELIANKDAASGYAGLTAGSLLKTAEFPALTGDVTSTSGGVATTVGKINGVSLGGLATGIIKNTTTTGVPSIAVAADIVALFSTCSSTQYLGADGACHAAGTGSVTSVSGTANQIASSGGTTPVISLPNSITLPGILLKKVNVVSFTATPTFDLSAGNVQTITLTGNVTSMTISNHAAGEEVDFLICQDATGSRTVAWAASALGAPTVGATASKCTAVHFYDNGTNLYATGVPMVNM